MIWDVIFIGGGAAGFFGAIACAEAARTPLRLLILEKSARPLGKVLVSGGGRCNVTNACDDPAALIASYPRGGQALRGAFARFGPADTRRWFERRGVALRAEDDGRVFPASNTAQTVVDCLQNAARRAGVGLRTQTSVTAIERLEQGGFQLRLRAAGEDADLVARSLVLACGGDKSSLQLAEKLGHTIEPPVPSLFTFAIADARLAGLAGVAAPQVSLRLLGDDLIPPRLEGAQQTGPLLITHWGVSGPAVLRLSAWAARWLHERRYRAGLEINWLHPQSGDQTFGALSDYKAKNPRQRTVTHSPFAALPLRLWKQLVEASLPGAQNWADLSKAALRQLAEALTRAQFVIGGKGAFKEEFVTCGGVRRDEMDFKTMASRRVPGLYVVGEALDVDGLTGGFNLQNAWTTGWIAGRALAGE